MTTAFSDEESGYLAGKLLIATPLIQESAFTKSVIYLCIHNAEGAMGLIINHSIANLDLAEVFEQLNIGGLASMSDFPVYFGGPVEMGRGFVIHTPDYRDADTVVLGGEIALTSSVRVLHDIAEGRGPAKMILALGYAGWDAGQLESEIAANSWMIVPSTPKLVFDVPPEQKWHESLDALGVDINKFSNQSGHA